jgi:hypothetical protein
MDSTPTTAGQAAYEGYLESSQGRSLVTGETLPSWSDQKPERQEAWEAAARAARAYNQSPEGADPGGK